MQLAGNVFLKGAKPCSREAAPLIKPDFDPHIRLVEEEPGPRVELSLDLAWIVERQRKIVTTDALGLAVIPHLPFECADGAAIRIDTDFYGQHRDAGNPFPGPFEPAGGNSNPI